MGSFSVAVVGCGLIGRKRATVLAETGDDLVACYDTEEASRDRFAADFGCRASASLEGLLSVGADAVIVAVPHDRLAQGAAAALEAGSHVLVEKPAGVSSAEIETLMEVERRTGRQVAVGFNHRYGAAISRAHEIVRSGRFGDLMFIRARYGHGGRVGYEREWRMNRSVSGGGEMVDQGMHLLDLFHWFLGPLPLHSALLRTHFWDAEVEDNAVLILGERDGVDGVWGMAHVTWTEWKNLFSMEIYCRTGKLQIDGLAGSYGPPSLIVYAMRPELGPPDEERIELPSDDVSWLHEWQGFRSSLDGGDPSSNGRLGDAHYAWSRIEDAYSSS